MANWLQLCRTPGSEHRHLIANMELHLSPPPGRHGEQEKYAQHAKDMPAGMVGGALHEETGAEGRWGGDVALTVGRGFQSNGSTAKLGFWSVYERKQEANRAGGGTAPYVGLFCCTHGRYEQLLDLIHCSPHLDLGSGLCVFYCEQDVKVLV